jgi:hypothetical protein
VNGGRGGVYAHECLHTRVLSSCSFEGRGGGVVKTEGPFFRSFKVKVCLEVSHIWVTRSRLRLNRGGGDSISGAVESP